jgi:hypothetical protein
VKAFLLIAAGGILPLSLPHADLQAQRLESALVQDVIRGATTARPDPVALGARLVDIDGEVTDLLHALAEVHGLRYSIPQKANPMAVREDLCGTCDTPTVLRQGYAGLQDRMDRLEEALRARGTPDRLALESLARETVLLAWALKGYTLAEATGVTPETMDEGSAEANSILGALGLGLTLYAWYGTWQDTGAVVDAFDDNRERHRDRRQQAEDLDLHYPNACWQTFLWANDCN